jgi:hypothetical protein
MLRFGCLKGLLRTLNHPPRRLTNGDRIIVIPRWHFIVTPDLSDRRHSNSDYATPAQLYRGNLPHCHWPGRRIPPVKTLIVDYGFSQVVAHSFPRLEGAAPHPDQCIETL